ncbi:MAG TPA: tRNA guanosine(34) transglycosylase Tgt, partial [Thermomicrobiaceae bacterium]|nr:tRNA guanosine(34) transglycosylase Tgt [Thermomicrobiaceae bacterium]
MDGARVNGAIEHETFELIRQDAASGARLGCLRTRRGSVPTPTFMPVGTQASVKALTPDEVAATGTRIVLANTYHLMLRPGPEILRDAGGLHAFMRWDGPILTDSGGFQIFSLAHRREVREEGVVFRSHLDGSKQQLTPESAIDLQFAFGSDIIMPLDELVGWDSSPSVQAEAMRRTHRWLRRALDHFAMVGEEAAGGMLLFGIAQGGFEEERRRESAAYIASLPVDGCAVGGLSVGEPKD